MTPCQLYEYASANIPDYKNEGVPFHQSRTISGTQKLHCFISAKNTLVTLHMKVFSNS